MEVMDNSTVLQSLQIRFSEAIRNHYEPDGILTLEVDKDSLVPIVEFAKEHLKFNFLTDICGVHFPDNKGAEISVVYLLNNMVQNLRLRLKVFLPIENPRVHSLVPLFLGANWMERETYDFYGILFTGHPNLKRILNHDEMDYHPLLKQYHLEDETREDKDNTMFGR